MSTSRELIGELIHHNDILENSEVGSIDHRVAEGEIANLEELLMTKTDGIDKFMMDLNRREHLIDAEVEALKEEVDRLKSRKNALIKSRDFFNKYLLPIIIREVGDDKGVYETNTARYKLFQTWGPLEITNVAEIEDQYIVSKIVESIDKKQARADAIAAKEGGNDTPSGFTINKVDRIRRS